MAQISVHRALTELKTLDAQILRAAQNGVFVAMTKGDKRLVTTGSVRTLTADAVKAKIESEYKSATDLIKRRAAVKSKIVASNAVAKVTVAGVEMTVAEAIERKDSIKYEQTLLATLRTQYSRVSAEYAQQQHVMDREISEKQAGLVGRETNARMAPEELKVLTDMIAQREQPYMLNPLEIETEITKLEAAITEFLADVDSALNESNAITKIDV